MKIHIEEMLKKDLLHYVLVAVKARPSRSSASSELTQGARGDKDGGSTAGQLGACRPEPSWSGRTDRRHRYRVELHPSCDLCQWRAVPVSAFQ